MYQKGHRYLRSEIHDEWGGSRQRGIANSARAPFIFLFAGPTGHQHGYEDGWLQNGNLLYTGEGQHGDMQMTYGNKAIRDHRRNGKRIFAFETEGAGQVYCLGELELVQVHEVEIPDSSGTMRLGYQFELAPVAS